MLSTTYARESQRPNGDEIWTINADGSAKQLIYHSACCFGSVGPVWSPGGTLIAFSQTLGAYVIHVDGSGTARLIGLDTDELAWLPGR